MSTQTRSAIVESIIADKKAAEKKWYIVPVVRWIPSYQYGKDELEALFSENLSSRWNSGGPKRFRFYIWIRCRLSPQGDGVFQTLDHRQQFIFVKPFRPNAEEDLENMYFDRWYVIILFRHKELSTRHFISTIKASSNSIEYDDWIWKLANAHVRIFQVSIHLSSITYLCVSVFFNWKYKKNWIQMTFLNVFAGKEHTIRCRIEKYCTRNLQTLNASI